MFVTVEDTELFSTRETLQSIDVAAYYTFALEILIVLAVSPTIKSFLLSPYTYLDLLGIVPYFISIAVDSLEEYRVLEFLLYLVPSTRLLKITRTSAGWTVLMLTVKRSFKPMVVPMFFLLFLLVFFSCALYFIEAEFITEYAGLEETTTKGVALHKPTLQALKSWFLMKAESANTGAAVSVQPTFSNIPEAFYYAAIVTTTVGLGDLFCRTKLGRLLSIALAICGVLYVALPISAFGTTFVEVWKDRERLLIIEKIKRRVRSYTGIKLSELQELFSFCDRDGSGVIDVEEFDILVNTEFKLDLPEYLLVRVFRAMGGSETGTVDFRQFCDFFFPHVVLKEDLLKARVPFKRATSAGIGDSVSLTNANQAASTTKRTNTMTLAKDHPMSPRTAKLIQLGDSQEAVGFLLQTVARLEKDLRTVSSTCRALQQSLQ